MTKPRPEFSISTDTARRFVLGRQGLWPGRRWRGKAGTLKALQALGSVQMDPLTIVARSHDLLLFARVEGYLPNHLQTILYEDRDAFDYGGLLAAHPMDELPHWRLHMERRREDARYTDLLAETGDLVQVVRALVAEHGPISAKVLTGMVRETQDAPGATSPKRASGSYRSSSPVSQLAYHLWLTGELMTHRRDGFERLFDLAERVAPKHLLTTAEVAETERAFALKALASAGLTSARTWRDTVSYCLHRRVTPSEGAVWLERLVAEGDAIPVEVEGQKGVFYLPADGNSQLHTLGKGTAPRGWTSKGPSTGDEVRLLSPLDPMVAGNRFGALFDFDHVWEIYKPDAKRTFGPFTMPLLHGDALVGRIDPRMDRGTGTLHLNGVWIERHDLAEAPDFLGALRSGIASFATFHSATSIEIHRINPPVDPRLLMPDR